MFRQAQEHPETVCPPQGEVVEDALARVQEAVQKILKKHRDGKIAIVVPEPLATLVRSALTKTPLTDLWRDLDLSAYPVHARVQHGSTLKYTRDGTGGNVLGDPRIALTWLANQLSDLGITLQKGQVVTTGTCMVPLELAPGDSASADYGPLGCVNMIFSET